MKKEAKNEELATTEEGEVPCKKPAPIPRNCDERDEEKETIDVKTVDHSARSSSCWSAEEDVELSKLVDEHGTSWKACLSNSLAFQDKFRGINDRSARDRLKGRWRAIKSQFGKNEGGSAREEARVDAGVHGKFKTQSDRNEDEAPASRPRRQRSAPVNFVARPSKNGLNCDEGDADFLAEVREECPTTRGTSSAPDERDIEPEPTKQRTDWRETEDAELTKLVNKHGNSWRDCLDDSTIFQEKYKHISDESARDRLRSRWRTIRKNTIDWSKQDYTEEDVRNEIARQVAEHGTDWKHILAVSSREFETLVSTLSSFMRAHHLPANNH